MAHINLPLPCTGFDPVPPTLLSAVLAVLPYLRGHEWHCQIGGRSNLVWRVDDVVIKYYQPHYETPLFPNDMQAEAAILRDLAGYDIAPKLLAVGQGWIAYQYQQGECWRSDASRPATFLGQLHEVPPLLDLRLLPMGSAQIGAHALQFAPVGDLPPVPQVGDVAPLPRPCLVHGDAVAGNVIVTSKGLRMIDWQCPGRGDPVDDIALFLSPAMQYLYRGYPLDKGEEQAFLAAYPQRETIARYRVLRPLLHWRIAAHCALRRNRGDQGYDRALRHEIRYVTRLSRRAP